MQISNKAKNPGPTSSNATCAASRNGHFTETANAAAADVLISADAGHLLATKACNVLPTPPTPAARRVHLVTIHDGDRAEPIVLRPDEDLTVRLFCNRTTGFAWHLSGDLRPPKKTLNEAETVTRTEAMVMGGKAVQVPLFGGRTEAYDYSWPAHALPSHGRAFAVVADKRRGKACASHTQFTFVRPGSSAFADFMSAIFSRR